MATRTTTDVKGLRQQMQAKIAEATKIRDEWIAKGEPIPGDEIKRMEGLLGESDVIRAQIDIEERISKGQGYLGESLGTQAAHLGWREAGPEEGMAEVDVKSWREVEIKTYARDIMSGLIVPEVKKIRYFVPESTAQKGYADAFEGYLRKQGGFFALGPNDRKVLSEGVDSAGGYAVPPEFMSEVIRKMATLTTVRQNARVAQTSRDIARWVKVNYTTDDKYTSPVRMTWTGEQPATATSHRVNEPVLGQYSIPVHTGMASLPFTNDLLEDAAFDIFGLGSDLLSEAFALGENNVFWNGNGVAQPMGILAQVDGDGPASVVSGSAGTLTGDGLIDLTMALPAQYERNAKFFMNKVSGEKTIRKLKDGNNDYLWPVWPVGGNFAAAPRELLGFPTVRDEFLPNVSAGNYPIVFGDLNGYLILDRVGLSLQRIDQPYAEQNITVLLARKRVGGQVIEPWRIKVQKVSA